MEKQSRHRLITVKRLLVFLLALAMVVSPVTTFAATGQTGRSEAVGPEEDGGIIVAEDFTTGNREGREECENLAEPGQEADPASEAELTPALMQEVDISLAALNLVGSEQEFATALASAGDEIVVQLTADLHLSQAYALPSGKQVTITSDTARTITAAAGQRHFTVAGGEAVLCLENIVLDGAQRGGGIYVSPGSLQLYGSHSVIRDCYSAGHGGAVWLNGSDTSIINGVEFYDNKADQYGGAVAISRGSADLANITVMSNEASNGGGVYYNSQSTTLKLTDSVISENKAVGSGSDYGNGGGIYLGQGGFTMENVQVTDNSAEGRGGGIMNYSNPINISRNSKISGNSAREGGGIYLNAMQACVIEDVEISGNVAVEHGGGIGVYSLYYTYIWPHIRTENVLFSGNALTEGGYVSVISSSDTATHTNNIKSSRGFSAFGSAGQFTHAYNNYDITNMAPSYRLFYEWMGGESGPADENEYAAGTSAKVVYETLCDGYEFLGWKTDYNSDTVIYKKNDDAEISMNKNITLYAAWKRNSYTVTVDVNGISKDYEARFTTASADPNQTAERRTFVIDGGSSLDYGQVVSRLGVPEQFGYRFAGWATADGGRDAAVKNLDYVGTDSHWGTKLTASEGSVTVNSDLTLYAVWEKDTFIIPAAGGGNDRIPENKLRVALSSMRETTNIELQGDVYLTESMKAEQLRPDEMGGMNVNIRGASGSGQTEIVQTATARHFHLRNAGTTAVLNLQNIAFTTTSGYGGIEVAQGSITVDGNDNSQIAGTGNGSGYLYGGALWVYAGGSVTLRDIVITDSGNSNNGRGGAIAAEGAEKLVLDRVTVRGNTASEGGGLYLSNYDHETGSYRATSVELKNSMFQGNVSVGSFANGGAVAIHNFGSEKHVAVVGEELVITNNTTTGDGGGIYYTDSALPSIRLTEVRFSGNEARADRADENAARYVTHLSDGEMEQFAESIKGSTGSVYGVASAMFDHPYNNYDVYYPGDIFSVTYDDNGADSVVGSIPDDANRYGKNALVVLPAAPGMTKANHTQQSGWSEDAEAGYAYLPWHEDVQPAAGDFAITKDTILYGIFVPEYYTITFAANGGGFADESTEKAAYFLVTEPAAPSEEDPKQDGAYFWHWSEDAGDASGAFDFTVHQAGDVRLYAIFKTVDVGTYVVNFHANGGTPVEPVVVTSSTVIADEWPDEDEMAKPGYVFDGWYLKNGMTEVDSDWGTEIREDSSIHANEGEVYDLYAKWNPLIEIQVPTGGGAVIEDADPLTGSGNKYAVDYNGNVRVKATASDGYRFVRWIIRQGQLVDRNIEYTDEAAFGIDNVKQTHSLAAIFERQQYQAVFYDQNDQYIGTLTLHYDETIPAEYFTPSVSGYTEAVWYTNEKREQKYANTGIRGNVELYLGLTPETYRVDFFASEADRTAGTSIKTISVAYKGNVTEPDHNPAKAYYAFDKWVLAGTSNGFDFAGTTVESDLELVAQWSPLDAPLPLSGGAASYGVKVEEPVNIALNVYFAEEDVNPGNSVAVKWYYTTEKGGLTTLYVGSAADITEDPGADGSLEKPYLFSFPYAFNAEGTYHLIAEVINTNANYPGAQTAKNLSHVVTVVVDEEVFTIDAEAKAGGTISPSETVHVAKGESKTFQISANSRHKVEDVLVDGDSVGAVTSYTFEQVNRNHTIVAVFASTGGSGGGSGGNKTDPDDEAKTGPETGSESGGETAGDDGEVFLELEQSEHIVYLHGYTDGTVRPDSSITRAEVAGIFYLLVAEENKEEPVSSAGFSDVSPDAWYYQQVAYLEKYHVLTGYLDGRFGPDDSISRAEFVTVASRFASLREAEIRFADIDEGHWAAGSIANVYARGWVTGYDDGTFRPDDSITRAEAVTIINKMLDRKIAAEDIPESANQFTDLAPSHWAYSQILEAAAAHQYERKADGFETWTSVQP